MKASLLFLSLITILTLENAYAGGAREGHGGGKAANEAKKAEKEAAKDARKAAEKLEKAQRDCPKMVNPYDPAESLEDCIALASEDKAAGSYKVDKLDKFTIKMLKRMTAEKSAVFYTGDDASKVKSLLEACNANYSHEPNGASRDELKAWRAAHPAQDLRTLEKNCELVVRKENFFVTHDREDFAIIIDRMIEGLAEDVTDGKFTQEAADAAKHELEQIKANELPTVVLDTFEDRRAFKKRISDVMRAAKESTSEEPTDSDDGDAEAPEANLE